MLISATSKKLSEFNCAFLSPRFDPSQAGCVGICLQLACGLDYLAHTRVLLYNCANKLQSVNERFMMCSAVQYTCRSLERISVHDNEQTCTCWKDPIGVRCTDTTWPWPPQVPQVEGVVPALLPLPEHTPHSSNLLTERSFLQAERQSATVGIGLMRHKGEQGRAFEYNLIAAAQAHPALLQAANQKILPANEGKQLVTVTSKIKFLVVTVCPMLIYGKLD